MKTVHGGLSSKTERGYKTHLFLLCICFQDCRRKYSISAYRLGQFKLNLFYSPIFNWPCCTDLSFTLSLAVLQLGGKFIQGKKTSVREGRVKFSVGSAPCLAAWEAGISPPSRENETALNQLQAQTAFGEPAGTSGDETCCAHATPQGPLQCLRCVQCICEANMFKNKKLCEEVRVNVEWAGTATKPNIVSCKRYRLRSGETVQSELRDTLNSFISWEWFCFTGLVWVSQTLPCTV